ncbi:hypothetical protein GF373_05240 [bacterium]|nr:hypothetical protein [bacterium]
MFFITDDGSSDSYLGYVDRYTDNYSTFIKTPLPKIDGQKADFIDVVNGGREFFLMVGYQDYYWANKRPTTSQSIQYYSVELLDNNQFAEPTRIGEMEFVTEFDHDSYPSREQVINYISEDGNTLVVQSLRRVEHDNFYFYDAHAFFRNAAGKWIKKQINPPNTKIVGNMRLSGSGQRLFWTPESHSSVTRQPLK